MNQHGPTPRLTRRAALTLAGMAAASMGAGAALGAPAPIVPPATPGRAGSGLRLLMMVRRGCVFCAAWDREIGPGYAGSPVGRQSPLMVVDIDGAYPDGLALARTPRLTPSFILLRDGMELGRIEGYVGARHFYPVLAGMMSDALAGTPGQRDG